MGKRIEVLTKVIQALMAIAKAHKAEMKKHDPWSSQYQTYEVLMLRAVKGAREANRQLKELTK